MSIFSFHNDLIDGLRGYSIIMVILFHSGIKELKNCFIGVDFTFLLSGYLLTKSSLNKKEKLNISEFYIKRLYRILPCYCIVLFVMVMYRICDGISEIRYLKEYLYSSVCLSNISLSKEKEDYFFAIHSSYLIPYWSLSIEFQFYLLFPLLLSINKVNKIIFKIALISILLLSFIYELYYCYMKESSIYYSFISRIWEFMLGILLSISKMKMNINSEILTLIMIIIPLLNLKMNISIYRLIELFLCMIILKIGERNEKEDVKEDIKDNNTKRNILLNNGIIKWFGKVSYVLYLIHYPILQLQYVLYIKLLIILIICIIIFEGVENKIQKLKISKIQKCIIILLFFLLPLLPQLILYKRFNVINNYYSKSIYNNTDSNSISYFKSNSSSIYRSLPLNIHTLNKPIDYSKLIIYSYDDNFQKNNKIVCRFIYINKFEEIWNNKPIAYLIGDSFALHWVEILNNYCYERNITLVYFQLQSPDIKSYSLEEMMKLIILNDSYYFDIIFISFSTIAQMRNNIYDKFNEYYISLVYKLMKYSDKIFAIEGTPYSHTPGDIKGFSACYVCLFYHQKYCYTVLGYNISFNPKLPSIKHPNYHVIDFFNSQFCYNNICSCVINNEMVYDTILHVNFPITLLFQEEFNEYVDKQLSFKFKIMKEINNETQPIKYYLNGFLNYHQCFW